MSGLFATERQPPRVVVSWSQKGRSRRGLWHRTVFSMPRVSRIQGQQAFVLLSLQKEWVKERSMSKYIRSAILTVLMVVGAIVSHVGNRYSQNHPRFREAFLTLQLMDFMMGGGGPLGPQTNYWAWSYTRRLQEPRPWWHHALFPESLTYQPFGYWVYPSEEWPYPPKT